MQQSVVNTSEVQLQSIRIITSEPSILSQLIYEKAHKDYDRRTLDLSTMCGAHYPYLPLFMV